MDASIATPDHRLRVFVSSTLQELAEERRAVEDAVRSLRLHPVMFEMGARPHPPRDVYQAYLDQSHIFIGVYFESYGWIAPGASKSGIEDEYDLAEGLPRLIYVRDTTGGRDPRLEQLLRRMAGDGSSYKRFRDAAQLRELVSDDLALLLTERFAHPRSSPAPGLGVRLPVLMNEFVGREAELAALHHAMSDPAAPLITIWGPAGVGKSRLALEVAWRERARFEDGAHLTMLEGLDDPGLVIPTIVASLDLVDRGPLSPLESLVRSLADRHLLLLLDNFERVLEAATEVVGLVARCPRLKVLVTSRTVLNVRGERTFTLDPLAVPDAGDKGEAALETPAARLLLARIAMARPTSADAAAIAEIARRLEGGPALARARCCAVSSVRSSGDPRSFGRQVLPAPFRTTGSPR